jgi:hypothetical protein
MKAVQTVQEELPPGVLTVEEVERAKKLQEKSNLREQENPNTVNSQLTPGTPGTPEQLSETPGNSVELLTPDHPSNT